MCDLRHVKMGEIFTAPWYPWYADDILLSERVELMNLAEEGAYRRALDRAWKKGSIPSDPVQCAKAIGKGCSRKVAEVVLTMFVPSPDDPSRMIQERLEQVREEQKQKYLSAADRGKKGGRPKKAQLKPSYSPAKAERKHSDSDTDFKTKDDETREATYAEKVLDGIRSELGLLQIAKEPEWLTEIEIAEKNGFSVEHCIETFCLMNKQDWRDTAIRPVTWSEQLPILHKLRTERERKNGTNKPTSEREKSSSRTLNIDRMANALINGDTTIQSVFGLDDENNIKGYLPS